MPPKTLTSSTVLPLSHSLLTAFPLAFCYFIKFYAIHIFLIYQPFINTHNHISTHIQSPISLAILICLFIPLFPFHYLFNFSSSSQTINQSPSARCKSSISLHLSTLLLLICMLVSLYALCLLLYSLLRSLCFSLQRLCVEYKLHLERMSCGIVLPLFIVINVSCCLTYACFY